MDASQVFYTSCTANNSYIEGYYLALHYYFTLFYRDKCFLEVHFYLKPSPLHTILQYEKKESPRIVYVLLVHIRVT